MDNSRFDSLARSLATPGSRRRALGGLLAGALGLLGRTSGDDAAAHDLKAKCKKKSGEAKKKCLKKAKKHAAQHAAETQPPPPRALGEACQQGSDCVSGQCGCLDRDRQQCTCRQPATTCLVRGMVCATSTDCCTGICYRRETDSICQPSTAQLRVCKEARPGIASTTLFTFSIEGTEGVSDTIRAGTCFGAGPNAPFAFPLGELRIREEPVANTRLAAVRTIPTDRLLGWDPTTRTARVRMVADAGTTVYFTNAVSSPCPAGANYCADGSSFCGTGGVCLLRSDGASVCGADAGTTFYGCTSDAGCQQGTGNPDAFCVGCPIDTFCDCGFSGFCALPR